jgi:alginate O-acetyltransferase complex protein AlgI
MNANHPIFCAPPSWAVMWLTGVGLFLAGKAAVRRRIQERSHSVWPRWKTAAWYLLWPGMNVGDFTISTRTVSPAPSSAVLRLSTGAILLWGLARHFNHPLAAGWCGMIGLILMMHFGAFDLLAAFWQSIGLRALPIMNRPAAALSLTDFWGHRWNRAFRDLAHPFVFAPAARRCGAAAALWLSFGISGLVHELMISVPARAGYGLPTAYFLVQARGMTLERRILGNSDPHAEQRVRRWFFTHAFTVLPAFILFHPPFVRHVMVPFFQAIGALP